MDKAELILLKLYRLLLILLLIKTNGFAQNSSMITDEKARNLRKEKKVKTITVHKYWANDTVNFYKKVYLYDTLGAILKETTYFRNTDNIERELIYSYDTKGNLLSKIANEDGKKKPLIKITYSDNPKAEKEIHYSYDGEKVRENSWEIEYFEDTLIKFKTTVFGWDPVQKTHIEFLYNDKKLKTREVATKPDGDTISQMIFTYDDKDRLKRKYRKDVNNRITQDLKYVYNENDEIISVQGFNPKGELTSKTDYIFKNRQIINYKTYYGSNLTLEVDRMYDEKGNFIHDSYRNERFFYNDKNLPVRMEKKDKKGKIEGLEKYFYTYY